MSPSTPPLGWGLEPRLGLSLGLWEGWGEWFSGKHPTHPSLRLGVRVKVGAGLVFRFVGGVGGWFLRNVPPTPPHP